ncbi:alpha/beta-hydrolase [Tilletiopsis washingtonensis]|uniref:Alpha/beta-hydrolase n=1 Tax=Tilletiopsis washingtonensis TaxID=58919 RepID=A0A316ZI88_9BASI|nr:alpha/beta-hydrolase [Tilletiopsis washingtonensis]PWN99993.1 alpha/beta-hydrolase [Tilletiopsis washingtonensis]
MPPATQTFKTPDGAQLAFRVHGPEHVGSVRPLVLIMGMSGVMEDWSPLVEALAVSRPVLISDHRAIGASLAPPEWDMDLSHEGMALDVLHLVASLGKAWRSVDMLGWSMGGHILQVLLTLPSAKEAKQGGLDVEGIHVAHAILTGTMTKLPRGDFHPDMIAEAAAKAPKDQRKRIMSQMLMEYQYFPEWLQSSQDNRDLVRRRVDVSLATKRPQEIIGLQIMAISNVDTRPELHRIPRSLPVLVIHGLRDRMVAYPESEVLMEHIKHAKRLQTPTDQIGHFWFDFLPGKYWRESIDEFLQQQGTPGAAKL